MSNKDNFKSWLNSNTTKAQTPAVPNTLYKTAYSKNITTEEWNALLSYLNKAIAKTNSWLTGFQESYDSIPDLSVLYNLKDNTVPLWDTSKQAFVNSTISVFDGLLKIANSHDKDRMDIDKNSFTVYTEDNDTGIKFKLPKLRSGVAEVSLLTDALPIRAGSGANAIVVNDISGETANVACSENTSAFGTGNTVGLKCYYWSSIDFTNKTITLSTAHTDGEPIACQYVAGDVISIVNEKRYDECSEIEAVNGAVVKVKSFPFTEVSTEDADWSNFCIYCVAKPKVGEADLGKASFGVGSGNTVLGFGSVAGGYQNTVISNYGTAFGRSNKTSYAGFATGRNNSVSGWYSAATGRNNSVSGLSSFAAGDTNLLSDVESIGLGYYNTLTKPRGYALGFYNVIKNPAGFAIGRNNTLEDANQDAKGTVLAFGQENVVKNSHTIALGRNNLLTNYNSHAFGTGLNSTVANQTLLGLFNDTSSTAPFVFGYGTEDARKNLATIESDGTLRLAGHELKLNTATANPSTLSAHGIDNLNEFLKYSSHDIAGWTYNRTFTSNHARVTNSLSVGGDLTVGGNFSVTGTTTVKDVKNLAVEDLTITLGKNLQGLGASLAGLVVPDYNGMQQPGGLVFDDTGTAYVGDVDRTSDGTVYIGNAKPIAVRSTASEWSDNNIPRWNTAFEGFEPSGFTTDSFVQKITDTGPNNVYFAYVYKGNVQSSLQIAGGAAGNTLARRTSTGALNVSAATENLHAVNLIQLTGGWVKKHVHASNEYDLLYGQSKSGDVMFSVATWAKAYAIPSYGERKTLQTSTASLDAECVNLKQMKDYAVPITPPDIPSLGSNTLYPLQSDGLVSVYGVHNGQVGLVPLCIDPVTELPSGETAIAVYSPDGSLSGNSGVDDYNYVNQMTLVDYVATNSIPKPVNQTPTAGQILEVSSVVNGKPVMAWADPPKAVRHWIATLVSASDPDTNGGQIEFWSTGTPNSTTNLTNFSDLFAKRVGVATIRNIGGNSRMYFVDMLGYGGGQGVSYYTSYPFDSDMGTSGVAYDSVTLSELA